MMLSPTCQRGPTPSFTHVDQWYHVVQNFYLKRSLKKGRRQRLILEQALKAKALSKEIFFLCNTSENLET